VKAPGSLWGEGQDNGQEDHQLRARRAHAEGGPDRCECADHDEQQTQAAGPGVFRAVVLAFSLPWQAAIGPIAILAGALFLVPRMSPSWSASEGAWIALLGAGGACVFGRYIMEQRRVARILEQRTHELEINEERNRMARDMHDILGHSLTVIALKTELATRLVDTAPDHARAEPTEGPSLAPSAHRVAHDVGDALAHHPGEELAQLGIDDLDGQREVGADTGRGQDVRGASQLAGQAQLGWCARASPTSCAMPTPRTAGWR